MKADGKLNINRQELRRTPLVRCPVCGKTSDRHNKAVHARAEKNEPPPGSPNTSST